jgi:hypothetical protein
MSKYIIKDSGKREEFASGMVRDTREGKGRYDLLPVRAIRRDAIQLERGALKYSDRNWELGAPFCRYIDSALRHLCQWLEGDEGEDHLAAARFNIGAIMELQERGRSDELDDRPGKHLESVADFATRPMLHMWENRS